jgi:hypothetical protein
MLKFFRSVSTHAFLC